MSQLVWFEIQGVQAVTDRSLYTAIQDRPMNYDGNHIRFADGSIVADFLTGKRGTGYKNFNPYDLRAINLTNEQDQLVRDSIRMLPIGGGPNAKLRVELTLFQDQNPSADILSLAMLERVIQRAIGQMEKVPRCYKK